MSKFFQIILFIFLGANLGLAQLNSENSKKEEVTAQLLKLTENLKHYQQIEPNKDSVYQIIERGKSTTEAYSDLVKIPADDTLLANTFARFYDQVGYFYYNRSDYLNALRYFTLSLGIYEQTKSFVQEGYNAQNVAAIFRQIGDDSEALRYAQRALYIFEEDIDDDGLAISLYTMAVLHREQGQNDDANEYAERSLSIYHQIEDEAGKARLYNLLAGLSTDQDDIESALNYYREALKIYNKINYAQGIANISNNIGVIYRDLDELEESADFLHKAAKIADSIDYPRGKIFSMVNLAEVYFRAKNYTKAKDIGKQALELAKQTLDIESVKKSAEFMIRAYQNESNWKKAFEMQEVVLETEKKISKQKKEQLLEYESIRFNYEREKLVEEKEREKSNSILAYQKDRQKIILIAAAIVILFLIFSLIVGYAKLKDSKKKNAEIQKQSDERKLLLQEVHHRVKNNFQIVSSLLRLQYYTLENKEFSKVFEEAIMRINAMSIVHDIIYKQEAFSDINAQAYFNKLLEQLKKLADKDIEAEAVISCGTLKIETLIHLGIITNELFINSLKYGFNNSLENPRVRVVLSQFKNHFELNYFENGKGLTKDEYQNSFGMDLISTIIEQHEGSVSIEDVSEPWSTHVKVIFEEEEV